MRFLICLIVFVTGKTRVRSPGDVSIENMLNADSIKLPEASVISCESGEIESFVSESIFASYITSDSLSVTTIIATDSDILVSGKLKIVGSIRFTSDLQLSMEEHSAFFEDYSSFLQLPISQWTEFGYFNVNYEELQLKQLPKHEYIQIIGNCHCVEGDVLMKVDGVIEWMQPCTGTHHIRSIINHSTHEALLEFIGSDITDPVIISFK